MLYQLPTGKVISITVEQFIELTDEDIQALIGMNYGESIHSPWYESKLIEKKEKKVAAEKEAEEETDKSIDFEPELDEPDHFRNPDEETNGLTIIETPDNE